MKSRLVFCAFFLGLSIFTAKLHTAEAVFTDNEGFFTPVIITKNLYFGMRNDSEVVKLQQALMERGYMSADQITGNFFATTQGAVKSFQVNHSIPATGYVGPLTRSESALTGEQIYLIGGLGNYSGRSNDVWSTPDGVIWTRETLHAKWDRRVQFGSAFFNNKFFVVGGTPEEGDVNDAFSSRDGVTWLLENNNLPWCNRADFSLIKFNGSLYAIGGAGGCTLGKNKAGSDVWSSVDGKTWNQVLTDAPWGPRHLHAAVVFNEKIWILGGELVNDSVDDVWSSPDGIKWTREVESAPWEPRSRHSVVVFKDQIFLVGGSTSNENGYELFDDVWSSTDGRKWKKVTDSGEFGGREWFGLSTLGDRLILTGGVGENESNHDTERKNDVWSSVDGKTWVQITRHAPWEARESFGLVRIVNP